MSNVDRKAGVVDLKKLIYNNTISESTSSSSTKSLMEIIDDIVSYLIENQKMLINDIEKNGKSINLIENVIKKYISDNKITLKDKDGQPISFDNVFGIIKSYIWGYGPLQPYVFDDDVSDILTFNKDSTRIIRKGKLKSTDVKFATDKALKNFASSIALRNEGGLSDVNAIQIVSDAKSQDSSLLRIDICGYPVVRDGANIVIRKIPRIKKPFDTLIKEGMMSPEVKKYLIEGTKAGLNIVWTGKGHSGKTTCMNTCLDYVPEDEVQLIIQESEELFTDHKATFTQRVKKKHGENDKEYTLKDETINALLMSLDRILIGEIKNEEAMEFFNAVYSGHIGWTSVHSPSAEECLNKIVHLMKYSSTDLPKADLMEMLTQIDVIVFMKDYKCWEIYEISGFNEELKRPEFNPMFNYQVKKMPNGEYIKDFKRVGNSCEKIMDKVNIAVANGKLDKSEVISDIPS